jgi:hypothetical protein
MTIKQLLLWICGLEMSTSSQGSDTNENKTEFIDITQTNGEKLFCNINAAILVCITTFVIAFFNRFI